MERRCHPRRHLVRNALLYTPRGFFFPCRVENVSSGGLFIKTEDTWIYKGSCVDVTIDATPRKTKPVTARALVVHNRDGGLGLLCANSTALHELFKDPQ